MLRKLLFVVIALALPLAASGAAGAQQYPPTGEGPHPDAVEFTPPPVEPPGDEAPLPRTGSDSALLVGVALALLAGGAVVVVATRRRTSLTA